MLLALSALALACGSGAPLVAEQTEPRAAFAVGNAGYEPDVLAFVNFPGHKLPFEGDNFLLRVDARLDRESDISIEAARLLDLLRGLVDTPAAASNVAPGTSAPRTSAPSAVTPAPPSQTPGASRPPGTPPTASRLPGQPPAVIARPTPPTPPVVKPTSPPPAAAAARSAAPPPPKPAAPAMLPACPAGKIFKDGVCK
jgi:hypothetical protein